MEIQFYKYQGTGNDFILIDDRKSTFPQNNSKLIKIMCDRRFGIGADGLILLQKTNDYDFKMQYFNSDGNESSMCGNGGRCIVAFAKFLNIIKEETTFIAIDGLHDAIINKDQVQLKMNDVSDISKQQDGWVLDTGSPHYVKFVNKLEEINVYEEGKKIRYSETFMKNGINVNFVEYKNKQLHIATYERGVENETLSCGTGVTAAAIIYSHLNNKGNIIPIQTKGGKLEVKINLMDEFSFKNIWLSGPAQFVFGGIYKY